MIYNGMRLLIARNGTKDTLCKAWDVWLCTRYTSIVKSTRPDETLSWHMVVRHMYCIAGNSCELQNYTYRIAGNFRMVQNFAYFV